MAEFAEMVAGINPPPRTKAMAILLVNSSDMPSPSAIVTVVGSTMLIPVDILDALLVLVVVVVVEAKKASPTNIVDRKRNALVTTAIVLLIFVSSLLTKQKEMNESIVDYKTL
mmetsp:Transcript_18440/g.37836  ORF Transcript_18440/g.37836 Transcript_18440/m.37836 type:complete len:113 (-) Transcript_18440:49-387(-)